ncbi:MAG TPA: hypothetical protein VGM76_05500 [Lacipirellulaceae bacterium]
MARQFKWWCPGIVSASLTITSGCGGRVALPDLYHPGPAGYQRYRATQQDPYPLDDVAEPVVGGRPREFQRPVPEPERAVQWDQRHAQAAGVAPAPTTFAPAPVGPPQPLPYSVPPVAGAPPPIVGSGFGVPGSGTYAAPLPTAPATAPYQLSIPATPVAPAPYPYGSPTPISPSPIPQFRPPY